MIDDVIQKLCDSGAHAVDRYAIVSGEDPKEWDMPEYFMPAMVFNQLGDEITMTLETNLKKLLYWNNECSKRSGMLRPPEQEEALAAEAQKLGTPRVDMVLYDGGFDRPKEQQNFLALVEWGKYWMDPADREKLLAILRYIHTCPYAATISLVEATDLRNNQTLAEADGDSWFTSTVNENYAVCARLFKRPL